MKTAFFSIARSKQLANAKVLLDSIKVHHPEAETFVVLAERPEVGVEISGTGKFEHQIITLDRLGIDNLNEIAFQYDAEEFQEAIKPWGVGYFFQSFESVVYFDPEVELFAKTAEILTLLTENEAVVTPCVTEPLPDDGLFPTNVGVMRSGQFHAGFFAMRSSNRAKEFVKYWKNEVCNGFATLEPFDSWMGSQLLFSGVISFIDSLAVLRGQNYHYSVWNASQRRLSKTNDQWTTGDGILVFLNFQGLNRPERVYGQPKWVHHGSLATILPIRDAVSITELKQALSQHEAKAVEAQKRISLRSQNYSFSNYSSGEQVTHDDRRIYLHLSSYEKRKIGDPFKAKDEIKKRCLTISKLKAEFVLKEIQSIKNGPSWKIGRAVTWPLRTIMGLMIKRNGPVD